MFYITTTPQRAARRWAAHPAELNAPRALPVDVREQDETYVLTAYVPGLKAEDLNIQIIEDTLTIEGEYGQHEGQSLMCELPAGSFRRALRLPAQLDAEKAEANIENGVLTLRIPKAESARPRIIKIASK
jgi:HSP20 family protein